MADYNEQIENLITGVSQICIHVKYEFFPRCEYKTRFNETSAFTMQDPDYWGTYFRSTTSGGNFDRISKLKGSSKTYKNTKINKPTISPKKNLENVPASKSGCYKSQWNYGNYREIFYHSKSIPGKIKKGDTLLYDKLLAYKKNVCELVVQKFSQKEISKSDIKLIVYVPNDYPCIMVQIKDFTTIKKKQSGLYNIVIAYFIAITNYIAYRNNIPIELVNRASFGHNSPSVSETNTSFRINIGIVPNYYAKVLAKSLELLNNQFLVPWLNEDKKFNLCFSDEELTKHNTEVENYNKKKKVENKKKNCVKNWKKDDSLFEVLCAIGNARGDMISCEITRAKKYVDLLTDFVHEYLLTSNQENIYKKDFSIPLREMLKKLTYREIEKDLRATLNDNDYTKSKFEFHNTENKNIKNESENNFWQIIKDILELFGSLDIENLSATIDSKKIKSICQNLTAAVNKKKIKGIYRLIEEANLEFIRHVGYAGAQTNRSLKSVDVEDDYGSDSDCEVIDEREGNTFYTKKITVATGMRAINVMIFTIKSILKYSKNDKEKKINTKFSYYETSEVEKYIQKNRQLLGNLFPDCVDPRTLKCIDLNHSCSGGPNTEQNNDTDRVVMLDYTSATTEKISNAIRSFIKREPVLLLASSGMKNEQVGADMNPYGTVRIIAKDFIILNLIYNIIRYSLSEEDKLPQELHNIRKAYKNCGAVVTNAAIYTKERKFSVGKYIKEDKIKKYTKDKGDKMISFISNPL